MICRDGPSPAPLDLGCDEQVCHAVLRIDAFTLELRAWFAIGGPATPIDRKGVKETARAVFVDESKYISSDGSERASVTSGGTVEGPTAGVYSAYVQPSDQGAIAFIGERSGKVIVAAGLSWPGTGTAWIPAGWTLPTASDSLACSSTSFEPSAENLSADPDDCLDESAPVAAPLSAARELALRTNLAAAFANRGPFAVYSTGYPPSFRPTCPGAAEYMIIFSTL